RLSLSPVVGAAVAALLFSGLASAQPAPAAGVPAVAAPPPPPPAAVAGTATAVQGVTPEYVGKAEIKKDARPEGWHPTVSAGFTVAFANNNSVVDQVDGTSFSIGMKGDL